MRVLRGLALLLAALGGAAPAEEPVDADALAGSILPAKREKAAAAWGEQGDIAAAKKVMGMLDDPDWGVQIAAIRALAPIRYEPGREAIRERAVVGPIRAVRVLAAEVLRDHDAKKSAHWFARQIKRFKGEERRPFSEALGIIGTEEGIETLEREIRAHEPEQRLAAAHALGRLRAGEAGLLRGLKDRKDLRVALASATALAGIDSDRARDALLDYLERRCKAHETYLQRRAGRRAAEANREAFVAALVERLRKSRNPGPLLQVAFHAGLKECAPSAAAYFRHRDALVRALAFRLAGIGDAPVPKDATDDGLGHRDRRVRYAAARASLAGPPEAVLDVLRGLLAHGDGDVVSVGVRRAVERRTKEVLPELAAVAKGETGAKREWKARVAACVALGRIGYEKMFGTLRDLARSRLWWLRAAALEGLYHTYTRAAIPVLLDAFDDRHAVARMTARRNLRYMTQQTFVKKSMYERWWEKWKDKLELKHPERKLAELDKYGYSRRGLQEILRGTDIVAIKGRWDKVELVLSDLEVKHQAVRAQELKDYGVSPKQIVLVNCEGSIDSTVTEYLQWMVVAGGYMATTDWSLVNATTKTFPHVVKGYVRQSTGNDVVVVEAGAPDHPVVKGVFRDGVELKWWLEIQAFPIAIEDPLRSTILVDSVEMLDRYGSSAMMVEFPAGLGKVLHSTSHFYLQKKGFAHAPDVEARKVFAADHLGLTIEEIRELDGKGAFGNMNDTTPISKSYSMFHLLANFINEKRKTDLRQ